MRPASDFVAMRNALDCAAMQHALDLAAMRHASDFVAMRYASNCAAMRRAPDCFVAQIGLDVAQLAARGSVDCSKLGPGIPQVLEGSGQFHYFRRV